MAHSVLILARRAAEYQQLVERAHLPGLSVAAATTGEGQPDGYDVLFGDPSLVARALPSMPSVRWVQSTWAGVEPLLDPALRRDYVLTNARGVFGTLMSEYVVGYMLAHERLLFDKYESQKQGRWDPAPPGSLKDKRIGLLGVGTIGAAIARTAKHFGMHVHGYRSEEHTSELQSLRHLVC